jgi:hypothetical protein
MRIELLRHDDSRIQCDLVNGATNQWDENAFDRHGSTSWLQRLDPEAPSVSLPTAIVKLPFDPADLKEAKALPYELS